MRIGKLYCENFLEFILVFFTIFIFKDYKFEYTGSKKPTIIDGGAHIGLSAVYFHRKYGAKIFSIEPDPNNLKCLRKNTKGFNIDIIPAILSKDADKKNLYRYGWSWGNSTKELWSSNNEIKDIIPVDSVTLSSLIVNRIDLLKLDIEGSETEVINEAKEKLFLVEELILEFHKDDRLNPENNLQQLVEILKKSGFRSIRITKWMRVGAKVKNISKLPEKIQLIIHAKKIDTDR